MRTIITSILIWSLTIGPALAWNATGHKIIASIAFRQLSAGEQTKTVEMLKKHPRFAQDFADAMPEEIRGGDLAIQNEWLFQQAAVWADTVRSGLPEKRAFNRGEWHYINLPIFLTDAARTQLEGRLDVNLVLEPPPNATTNTARMNAVQVIRLARKQCSDTTADPQDRGLLLAWLFHVVGDIHQPLHSSALFSTRLFPTGDRGGNSIKTHQAGNLHSLWDQFPGQRSDYRSTHNKAIAYTQDRDRAAVGSRAAAVLDEKQWLTESHTLANSNAYAEEVTTALRRMESAGGAVEEITLTEGYLKAGGHVAEQRLVEAGYRLGAVLKEIAGR